MNGGKCNGWFCPYDDAATGNRARPSANRAWSESMLDLVRMRLSTILLYTPFPDTRFRIEERTVDDGFIASTYDKSLIKMCIDNIDFERNPSGQDTLIFVALHELAHVINDEQGHTPAFWDCFAGLLAIAQKLNYWTRPPPTAPKFAFCRQSVDMTKPEPMQDLEAAFGRRTPKGRRYLAPANSDLMFDPDR